MKKSIVLFTGIAGLLLLAYATPTLAADEGKDVTIKGTAMCAKCALHEGDSCQTVIKTEKGGKKHTYYLASNDVAKGFHKTVCQGEKQVTATGTVKEVDGKKQLTVSKIEVAEGK
jgi:hypothetical protein